MLSYDANHEEKTMEFRMSGKVTLEEYDKIMSQFKKDFAQWDEVKVLAVVENLENIEPKVLLKDMKYAINEFGDIRKKFKKCAVVAPNKWMELVTEAYSLFMEGEIKFFDLKDEQEARKWMGMANTK